MKTLGTSLNRNVGRADYDGDFPTLDPTARVSLYGNVDGQGGTIANKPVYSLDQIIANMNRTSYPGTDIPGPRWSSDPDGYGAVPKSGDPLVLSFGFQTEQTISQYPYVYEENGQLYGRSQYFGFQEFSDAQKAAARSEIALWDDVVAVRFQETTADKADITYGNYVNQPGTQAYAYLPYNYDAPDTLLAGDVWVNGLEASNLQLAYGEYGRHTLVHETGHALGLQHPGEYNAAPGRSITYAANAEYYQDTRQYSVMSYFNAENSGAGHIDWNKLTWVYSATPLIHDIATAQAIYGADRTTRTGDTVYGFNSTANRDVFNFAINTTPVFAIWDAGGNDTLDFSGWNTPSTINLNPGGFSSGGGSGVVPLDVLKARGLLPASYTQAQYDALRARYNAADGLLHDNISIAYGAWIENAVGGGGNDLIIANAVANKINGGAGIDTVSYREAKTGIGLSGWSMSGYQGDAKGDTYVGVEKFEGSAFADTLQGGVGDFTLSGLAGNDTLLGGLGNDTLDGGAGNDQLDGGVGNDTLTGGDDNDTMIGGLGNDTLDGGAGNDQLDGGVGNDVLRGGDGNDQLIGNLGADVLTGGAGNDTLDGGSDNDVLNGGAGNDWLTGGGGADRFVFTDLGGRDVVNDFQTGLDRIDLSGIDAITGGAKDAFKWIGDKAFSGAAGELRAYAQGGSFFVAGDVNGDGVADFLIQTNVAVHQNDLVLA